MGGGDDFSQSDVNQNVPQRGVQLFGQSRRQNSQGGAPYNQGYTQQGQPGYPGGQQDPYGYQGDYQYQGQQGYRVRNTQGNQGGGYNYQSYQQGGKPKKKSHKVLIGVAIAVCLILVIGIVGGGGGSSSSSQSGSGAGTGAVPVKEPEISYTPYTMGELESDLEANPLRASDKYLNQYVAVTGELSNIDSSGSYFSIVPGEDIFEILGCQCSIKSDEVGAAVRSFDIGDIVTVRGKITTVGEVLHYKMDVVDVTKVSGAQSGGGASSAGSVSSTGADESSSESPSQGASSSEPLYEITWSYSQIVESRYSDVPSFKGYVEITNTSDSVIQLKDASFEIESPTGELLRSEDWVSTNPDYIAPGEKGYAYIGAFGGSMTEEFSAATQYVFVPRLKVKQATESSISRFDITDLRIGGKNLLRDFELTGRVWNNFNREKTVSWIFYVFYDAAGVPIAVGGTNAGMPRIEAGDYASFDASVELFEGYDVDDIASYWVVSED